MRPSGKSLQRISRHNGGPIEGPSLKPLNVIVISVMHVGFQVMSQREIHDCRKNVVGQLLVYD